MRSLRGALITVLLLAAWQVSAVERTAPVGHQTLIAEMGRDDATAGLGVNVTFPETTEADLRAIAAAGFHLIRFGLLWADVERSPGRYDWTRSDALIDGARRDGLRPVVVLAYSNPLYARRLPDRPNTESLAYAAPMSGKPRAAYMAYVRAAAARYGDRVIWEVWNEPDHNFGDPVDLHAYTGFAMDACRTLREAAPDAAVIGPAASAFVWPFLTDFVRADQAGCFDAVSVHPYLDAAPEGTLPHWDRAWSIARSCGHPGTCPALADSENGYSSTGGFWSETRQANYVVRQFLVDQMAGVKLSIIYDWRNDGTKRTDKEANFGLVDFFRRPKPALAAISNVADALDGLNCLGEIVMPKPNAIVLAFGRQKRIERIVAWSATDQPTRIDFAQAVCLIADPRDEPVCPASAPQLHINGHASIDAAAAVFAIQPSGMTVALTGSSPDGR